MKPLVDSSAFAKRYVFENGKEVVGCLLQNASQLALHVILVPEVISGLNHHSTNNPATGNLHGRNHPAKRQTRCLNLIIRP